MSAVIPWIGEPPDPIHLEAREKIVGTWLRDSASGEFITQTPWIVDGITDTELETLDALNYVSRIESELMEAILAFPWVADGVDYHEQSAFEGLFLAGENNLDLLRVLVSSLWVVEGPGQAEASLGEVFDRLHTISDIDRVLAVEIVSDEWIVDGVNPAESVLLSVVPRYFFDSSSRSFARPIDRRLIDAVGQLNDAWTNQPPDPRILDGLVHVLSEQYSDRIFDQIRSEPWLRDGLDAIEAVRAAIFLTPIGGWGLYRERSDSPLVPNMTISLPLAGDVRVWLVNADDVAIPEDEMLAVVEEAARFSEGLLGAPFPTTDIIVDILDPRLPVIYQSCTHQGTHIRWGEDCDIHDLARVVAQYYFSEGNSSWLSSGVADLVKGYVNDRMGVETLADRRARLARDVMHWADEKGLANVANLLYYNQLDGNEKYRDKLAVALYQLGEHLLHNLTSAMGQPAMSAALRELHIPARTYFATSLPPSGPGEIPNRSEEEIFETFLKYTSQDQDNDVRDVYGRLHGGAFAFPEIDLQDEHGNYPTGATDIEVGQAVGGVLDYPGDLDFFRFKPEKDRKYIVKVDHESLGISGVSLYLYYHDSAFIYRPDNLIPSLWTWKSRRQTPPGPQMLWMAPSSFERYFAVENFGAETGPYTLTITQVEDVEDDHGDSLSTATNISLGTDVVGAVDNDFDYDYFRFDAVEDRRYRIEVVPETLQYFRTRLFNAHNAIPWPWSNLYADDEADGPGEFMRSWKAPDSGAYYLAIDGYKENLGTYAVRITDLGGD